MNAPATSRGRAPDVDEGDARDLAALLRRELRPTPGRLADSVRIVIVLLVVVAIAETFRLSEIALSGYIVLFLSGREAVTTILTALLAGIAVILAIFVAIAVFMLSLSEPALRIPLMAVMTFVAMFLSRTVPDRLKALTDRELPTLPQFHVNLRVRSNANSPVVAEFVRHIQEGFESRYR